MIRASVSNELRKYLDQRPFVLAEDYSIETTKESKDVVLTIRYEAGTNQYFKATIPYYKKKKDPKYDFEIDFEIKCEFDPGDFSRYETTVVWGIDNLYKTVEAWSQRIAEDIKQEPAFRAIKEQTARIDELKQKIDSVPDGYATAEQASKLKQLIADVEKELRERIEKLETDGKERQKKLEALAAEFAVIKERVQSTTLKNVLRSLASRLWRFSSDPSLGTFLENGSKIAGLLGDGSKSDT